MRAGIRDWLKGLGLSPVMSDENGFPASDGIAPYVSCLRVLEECPLVIGVIDRRYGYRFADWTPYKLRDLSPTHAELQHALDLEKRVLIYVHQDIWTFYEAWRKNKPAFEQQLPPGLEVGTLELFEALKRRTPAPWLSRYTDVADVLRSLQGQFVNHVYEHLLEREKQRSDQARYFLDKIEDVAPEIRARIDAGMNPSAVAERSALQLRLDEISQELTGLKEGSQERIRMLETEKGAVEARAAVLGEQLRQASLLVGKAALRDIAWLHAIRTQLMPQRPGRVPFHHSGEIALRGYKARVGRTVPVLIDATWARLPEREDGLARGGSAGVVLKGHDFLPGCTLTRRQIGSSDVGGWMLPSIYYGDYLELSTAEDELETPLGFLDFEFQVRNPEGETSEWVPFMFSVDLPAVMKRRDELIESGVAFCDSGLYKDALTPLRRAANLVFRLRGRASKPDVDPDALHQEALRRHRLSQLRFAEGAYVVVNRGPHQGKGGQVVRLMLNHRHAYVIRSGDGDEFQAADDEVESSMPPAS